MAILCLTALAFTIGVCLLYYVKVVCAPSSGTVVQCSNVEYLDTSDSFPMVKNVTSISVAFEHHEEFYNIKGRHKIPEGKSASIRLLANPLSESAISVIKVGARRYIGRKYAIR